MREQTPFEALKARVKALGSKAAVARSLKITPQYLGDVLHKRRPVSDKLAKRLGFEKISYYNKLTVEQKP